MSFGASEKELTAKDSLLTAVYRKPAAVMWIFVFSLIIYMH